MSGYEPNMSWAKCNCPWNPDSHANDCPIYARNYIDTLRTANQRLEGEVARLRADADRLVALVAAKLSLDVRTLCVVVERDVYNKDDEPIVRYFQNDADQRLFATRDAIDAALAGDGDHDAN